MIIRLLVLYLLTSSMDNIASIIQPVTSEKEHFDSNANDTKYLNGLELETRYRELSRTLSEFNGDDSYGLYSKNDHINENSGNGPLSSAISDDEDLAILSGAAGGITDDQEFGSGFTFQSPVLNANKHDVGEDNSLVDILSSKIDHDDKNGIFRSVEDDSSKEFSSAFDADNFLNSTSNVLITARTFVTSMASTKAATVSNTIFRTKIASHDEFNWTMAGTTSTTVKKISKTIATTGTFEPTTTVMAEPKTPAKTVVQNKTSFAARNDYWSMFIFLALAIFILHWTTI